jgi:hypothetical protein
MASVDMSVLSPPTEEEEGKSSGPKHAPGTRGVLHLNSNDKVYTEVRDLSVQAAGPTLTAKAKELQSFREQIKKSKNMEVSDIHAFVKAIPTLQQDSKNLRVMVDLLSQISLVANGEEFISRWNMERGLLDEEGFKEVQDAVSTWIAKRAPLISVLRLLCLDSVVEGGLKTSKLDSMRKEIINSYGYETLFSLINLEKAGLLSSREGGLGRGLGGLLGGSAAWTTLRKTLSLTVPEVNTGQPQDIHYVTAGYAPLSVRLIQSAIVGITPLPGSTNAAAAAAERPGWESIADALRVLPGPSIQITQVKRDPAAQQASQQAGDADGARKVCLAVFVGGCTHIEVSALRFLSERSPVDFVVLTTSMLHGGQLLESLLHPTPGLGKAGLDFNNENADAGGGGGDGGAGAAMNAAKLKGGASGKSTSSTSAGTGGKTAAPTGKGAAAGGGGLFGFGKK